MMQRLFGVARVLGLLCLLQLCAGLFLAHQARANTEHALERVGNWLAELQGVVSNQPTPLWINGLRLWLASGHSAKSPGILLDDFESYCNGKTGMSLPQEALDRASDEQSAAMRLPNRHGVFRIENAERGFVACLDGNGATVDAATFAEQARTFLRTGDLATFGELRYFLVLPGERGGSAFLTAWTRGSAKLLEMFPDRGDAPGEDLANIPRPAAARRQLSAGVPGMGHLASYSLGLSIDVALEGYRAQLIHAGWKIRPVDAPHSLLAISGGRAVLVTASDAQEPTQSRLTLSEL